MYQFKLEDGAVAKIYFSHKGGKKGTTEKPGKPPRITMCTIVANDTVLGVGTAHPVHEVAVTVPSDMPTKYIDQIYGRRLKKIVKTDDGKVHAVLKGDTFSRKNGRKESLRKALCTVQNRADRKAAWAALNEEPILLTEKVAATVCNGDGSCSTCTCK